MTIFTAKEEKALNKILKPYRWNMDIMVKATFKAIQSTYKPSDDELRYRTLVAIEHVTKGEITKDWRL